MNHKTCGWCIWFLAPSLNPQNRDEEEFEEFLFKNPKKSKSQLWLKNGWTETPKFKCNLCFETLQLSHFFYNNFYLNFTTSSANFPISIFQYFFLCISFSIILFLFTIKFGCINILGITGHNRHDTSFYFQLENEVPFFGIFKKSTFFRWRQVSTRQLMTLIMMVQTIHRVVRFHIFLTFLLVLVKYVTLFRFLFWL